MKVKCYGLFEGEREILIQFANPSQKDFLDYQLKTALKRLKKSPKIQFQNTANGVWYCRQHPNSSNIVQMILLAKQSSSVSYAANFLNKSTELEKPYDLFKDRDKIKIKIADLIRIFNANKIEKLSTNVTQLEGIIKGNMNKMMDNMSQLGTAQRKSEMMAQLSMQFERDSKALQQKMKRRKLLMKLLFAGIIVTILGIVLYILFF